MTQAYHAANDREHVIAELSLQIARAVGARVDGFDANPTRVTWGDVQPFNDLCAALSAALVVFTEGQNPASKTFKMIASDDQLAKIQDNIAERNRLAIAVERDVGAALSAAFTGEPDK